VDGEAAEMRYRMVPVTIYDSLGNQYVIQKRFTYHPDASSAAGSPHGYWTMETIGGWYTPGADGGPWVAVPAGETPPATARFLTHAFLEGDRTRPPALISICFFGANENIDEGVGAGGSVTDFVDDAISQATIAFNSNGTLVGIGMTDGEAAPGWPAAQAFTPANGDYWTAGRNFAFRVIPVSGVNPSATFGATPFSSASHYQADPAATIMNVGTITFDFAELGQRGGENTTIRSLTQDGGGPGTLMDISVGQDGTIMGRFSNGRDRLLGQIPLAFFTNPAGLERVGNSFWRTTANSGPFDGVGLVGQMIGGALEGSNVDLANEFTEMITTQRGFQAASRTITVSDEMLQELVNLRR
jgi:flagellar hook-basal body protein